MLTKKQIERIEDKLNYASVTIAEHEHRIEKIADDDSISEEEKNTWIEKRREIIRDKIVRIDAIIDTAFILGYLAKIKVGDDGVYYYSLERI